MLTVQKIQKLLWEDTPAGKLERKIKKLHVKLYDDKKITDVIERWIDIHRATTMSKERDLIEEYQKMQSELEERYREKYADFMCEQYQKEIDYLTKLV